jgi:hypothetical protein
MQRTLVQRLFLLFISLLLLASCASKRPALRAVEPSVNVEQEGLAATLAYRDDESLTRQFGKETNPFRTEYTKLQFRRRLVFDLTLENRGAEAYPFRLKDCELQYGGKNVGPTNQFQLIKEWDLMDENAKLSKQKEPVIKKHLLPNEKPVPPAGVLRGLLLFEGNLPAHGQARVLIPGVAEGSPLEFQFEF